MGVFTTDRFDGSAEFSQTATGPETSEVVAALVDTLTQGLRKAFEDLARIDQQERASLAAALGTQEAQVREQADSLSELRQRMDSLKKELSDQVSENTAVREKQEDLTLELASLQETEARNTETTKSAQELTDRIRDESSRAVQEVSRLAGTQQEELTTLRSAVDSISPKVNAVTERLDERLDRVTTEIEGVCELQQQREAALGQLGSLLTALGSLPKPSQPEPELDGDPESSGAEQYHSMPDQEV